MAEYTALIALCLVKYLVLD